MVLEFPNGIRIEHEDVVATARRGLHYDTRLVTFRIGDVKIGQGTLTMWGDKGEYSRLECLAVMRRNVRIVDEGWELTCDEARYFRDSDQAWLIGNIVAKDSTSTLYADSLFYDRNTAFAEVFGDVRITNLDEGFTAEGDHGYYMRDTGEGVIDRNPHLIVDSENEEPVTVDSDTMRVYPDDKRAIAYYRVKILKGLTVTQADSAVLFDDENRAELYGNPLAKQDRVSMKGVAMVLRYDEEEVNRIDIDGGAEIREEQTDTLVIGRDSWIRGDTMSLYLKDNRVDSIRVLHNAVSKYYPVAPNKAESNFVRGDSMLFQFEVDSLSYVRITGSADGVYKFLDFSSDQTPDSLRAVVDTNLTYVSFDEKGQKVVYSAKRIEYYAKSKDLILNKEATITYQGRTLSGEEIAYLSAMQVLDAKGEPKLVDEGQEFFGRRMNYDLDAGAGLVNEASTRMDPGFYEGQNVAKVGDNEMKVWNSRYTTCDLLHPHFHVRAWRMKVYPKDQAVSGSTVMYIGETPVFYIPFFANSIRRGRRSGFLRPDFEFGVTKSTGRYIRNIGYFWATNDFTDFKLVFDFNEDRQTRGYIRNRYDVRYKFNGEIDGSFLRDLTDNSNRWEFRARHNHNLGEKFTMKADLRFVSDDDALKDINRIDDVDRVIDREIRSNFSIAKTWSVVGLTLTANRTQKLNVVDPNVVRVSTLFPNLTLSIPQRDLFFGERHREGQKGFWEQLLSGVKYSPGLSGRRTTEDREFVDTERVLSTQSLGFQSPQKIGFVTLSPTLSSSNTFTRTVTDTSGFVTATSDTINSRTVDEKNEFRWGFGANSSARIFGTFYPRVGRLRGVRHTIAPVVSYNFSPKVGDRERSQRFSVRLTNTIDLKMLRKAGRGRGATGASEMVTRTPGTRSVVDAEKARPPDGGPPGGEAEEGEEEEDLEKVSGFLVWALNTTYNPQAPKDQGWSDVRSALSVQVFGTTVSINQVFEPYELELRSTSVQTRFTLKGSHPFGRSEAIEVQELNVVAAADTSAKPEGEFQPGLDRQDGQNLPGGAPGMESALALEEGRLPWNLRVGFSYNKTAEVDARATVDLSGDFNLTKNWRFTYWTSYDIMEQEMRGQNFGVHRDLHCWEMSLSRQLLGDEWQFYFRIAIKAHPELYGETGQRGLGGFAGGLASGSSMFTNY